MDTDLAQPSTFGAVLKGYRVAAGLTQEGLAERARLSTRAIAALEQGTSGSPRKETLALLATALRLTESDLATLKAAALRPPRPRSPASLPRHPAQPSLPPERTPLPRTLPVPLTPLLGREIEMTALASLLQQVETRLVTLTGPGGVGKTHVAQCVALRICGAFSAGVAYVSLAPISDAGLVLAAIAQAVGVTDVGQRSLLEHLSAILHDKRLLLVLDNFEHVVGAAPAVTDLLRACPSLTVLSTSRCPLRVRGEQVYPLAPLPLPDPARLPDRELLAASAAVQLFLRQARCVRPDIAPGAAELVVIARICAQVDGLPLAIELAAAHVDLLPPPALLARLEGAVTAGLAAEDAPPHDTMRSSRLRLLTGGARDLPARQQTLSATIAWSYGLLSPVEQALFRHLAVFRGGCTLELAEAMCAGAALSSPDLRDGLASLLDNGLLRHGDGDVPAGCDDREPRFGMLETVREFGLEALAATDEIGEARRAHAAALLSFAVTAHRRLAGGEQGRWLGRLERESDNLRAALQWALETGEASIALRLGAALWPFWRRRGALSEGRRWLEECLALAAVQEAPAEPHAQALNGAGVLAFAQGDYARATELFERSLALSRALGDMASLATVYNNLGNVAADQGDYTRALAFYSDSLSLRRERGDQAGIAASLNNLGLMARYRGDYERAAALYRDSLALKRALGDTRGIAVVLNNLGLVARDQGDQEQARDLYEQSLALFRELTDHQGIAYALNNLGVVARDRGLLAQAVALHEESLTLRRAMGDQWAMTHTVVDLANALQDVGAHDRAATLYDEGLALLRRGGDRLCLARCLEGMAALAARQEQFARARALSKHAAHLRAVLGAPLPPVDRPPYDQVMIRPETSLAGTAGRQ